MHFTEFYFSDKMLRGALIKMLLVIQNVKIMILKSRHPFVHKRQFTISYNKNIQVLTSDLVNIKLETNRRSTKLSRS